MRRPSRRTNASRRSRPSSRVRRLGPRGAGPAPRPCPCGSRHVRARRAVVGPCTTRRDLLRPRTEERRVRRLRSRDVAVVTAHPIRQQPAAWFRHVAPARPAILLHRPRVPPHGLVFAGREGADAALVRQQARWWPKVGTVGIREAPDTEVQGPLAQVPDGGGGLAVMARERAVKEQEKGLRSMRMISWLRAWPRRYNARRSGSISRRRRFHHDQ